MSTVDPSLSISNPHPNNTDVIQKVSLVVACLGVLILFMAWGGVPVDANILLPTSLLSILVGTTVYAVRSYMTVPAGIKNNGVWHSSLTNRGALGWASGMLFTGFYVLLYWYPEYLGAKELGNEGFVALFDPLSQLLKGKPATHWFLYGTLYTLLILSLGIKFMFKYRHNRYQLIRTIVVVIAQLFLAYLIPELLEGLNSGTPYFAKDLKQIWPLNYYIVEDWYLDALQVEQQAGPSGLFYFFWSLILFLILTPVLTYYVGKRWYCSWVCGCGGLAETAGDPFRHLSSKTMSSWKLERWVVHSVMVFVLIMSIGVFYTYFSGKEFDIKLFSINKDIYANATMGFLGLSILVMLIVYFKFSKKNKYLLIGSGILGFIFACVAIAYYTGGTNVFFVESASLKKWYGFGIGAAFSGVIGVGFYPILGNRVWCRFGCPMAGYMGIIQRFKSKFRITTNGGQCISCGNCSTYCEQGIDVRAYAQKGQNIVRASCVGCGVCSAVCPRGVLKLENGSEEARMDLPPIIIGNKSIKVSE